MRVLITGAGKGLGLELVRYHLEQGDYVYALTHSMTEDLNLLSASKNISIICIELTDEEQVKNCLAGVEADTLDAIYNVAGIWFNDQMTGLEGTDSEKVRQLYLVNAVAPLNIMKYGRNLLKQGATVLNVSSEAGSISNCRRDNDYGYCMSKAALNMASYIFRNEMKDREIRVLCYHPGWMRTQMGGERAARSNLSISARESAEALTKILWKEGEAPAGMYFDYMNQEWEW